LLLVFKSLHSNQTRFSARQHICRTAIGSHTHATTFHLTQPYRQHHWWPFRHDWIPPSYSPSLLWTSHAASK